MGFTLAGRRRTVRLELYQLNPLNRLQCCAWLCTNQMPSFRDKKNATRGLQFGDGGRSNFYNIEMRLLNRDVPFHAVMVVIPCQLRTVMFIGVAFFLSFEGIVRRGRV